MVVVPLTVRLPDKVRSLNPTFELVPTFCPMEMEPSLIPTPVPALIASRAREIKLELMSLIVVSNTLILLV